MSDRLFLETRFAPDEAGAFTGYAARFQERNAHNEIVERGAFKRTIAEHAARGFMPPLLMHHDPRHVVGSWVTMTEDGEGLAVTGQFAMRTTAGREAYELVKAGALTGVSVGFRERAGRAGGGGVRILTDIELVEVSLVALPSADRARIGAVRNNNPSFLTAALEAASFIRSLK